MAGFREQLYRFIRDDVELNSCDWDRAKQPLLLRYLKEQEETRAGKLPRIRELTEALSKGEAVSEQGSLKGAWRRSGEREENSDKRIRTNAYADLLEADLLRQLGVYDEREYLCCAFELILGKKKTGIPGLLLEKTCSLLRTLELPPEGRIKEWVDEISNLSSSRKRTGRTMLEELVNALREADGLVVKADSRVSFEERLEAVTEELFHEILVQKSKTWLDDNDPKKARKVDNSMQLLDMLFDEEGAFFEFEGHQEGSAELTGERMEQTQKLFDLLDRDPERRSVVIPVMIDPFTGMGLYIIGAGEEVSDFHNENIMIDYDDERYSFLKKNHNCAYAVFSFTRLVNNRDDYRDASYGFLEYGIVGAEDFGEENGPGKGIGYIFPGDRLDDAIGYYKSKLKFFDKDDRTQNFYTDYNGLAPEGCPEPFLRYFTREEDTREFEMRIDACKEEEKRALESYGKIG